MFNTYFAHFSLLLVLALSGMGEVVWSAENIKPEEIACSLVDCQSVDKKTQVLSNKQKVFLKSKFHLKKLPRALVQTYILKKQDQVIGYGIIDTHLVRSKSETLLFVFSPSGEIINIEVLAFFEPPEYRPSEALLKASNNLNQKAQTLSHHVL